MGKPSKFSRTAGGTTVKNVSLKSKHALLNSAHVISFQAKKEAPKLKEKIQTDTLKYSIYNSRARRHAFQKELEKEGIQTKKIGARRFVGKHSRFNTPTQNEILRSELMIICKTHKVEKRLGAKDFLRNNQ